MSTPGGIDKQRRTWPLVSSTEYFIRFRGILDEARTSEIRLPWIIDAMVLLELTMLLLSNALLDYHPIVWLVALLLVAYLWVLVFPPRSANPPRLLLIAATCMLLAIAIPWRTGEPVLVTAYAAIGAMVAVYYALGSRVMLWMAAAYLLYVGYAMFTAVSPVGSPAGYALTGVLGVATVLMLVGLIANHMSLQSHVHRQIAERRATELEQVLLNLRVAASAGNVGTYSYMPAKEQWIVNSSFRQLFELPEQAYPSVKTEDVLQRIAPDELEYAVARLAALDDQGPGSYQLQMPSGRDRLITTLSQVVFDADGTWTRHGVVYENQARDETMS